MVENEVTQMDQVGLALDLITNKAAFGTLTDAQFRILGYRDEQRDQNTVGYQQVLARARDVVLKAIIGDKLPEVAAEPEAPVEETPEEKQEREEPRKQRQSRNKLNIVAEGAAQQTQE